MMMNGGTNQYPPKQVGFKCVPFIELQDDNLIQYIDIVEEGIHYLGYNEIMFSWESCVGAYNQCYQINYERSCNVSENFNVIDFSLSLGSTYSFTPNANGVEYCIQYDGQNNNEQIVEGHAILICWGINCLVINVNSKIDNINCD